MRGACTTVEVPLGDLLEPLAQRRSDGLTEVDTAEVLGVVKSQTAKALARLRTITFQLEEVRP